MLDVLVQLGAQVARNPFADHRHEPQPHVCSGLPDEVQARHRRHRHPGHACGRAARQPSFLRRTHDAVDDVARRGTGGTRLTSVITVAAERPRAQLAPVRLQIAEQPDDHPRVASRDERLRIANRSCDRVGVDGVGVGCRDAVDGTSGDALIQREANVLERTALSLGVAKHRRRRFAGRAEQHERVGAQTGRLTDGADAPRSTDRTSHAPSGVARATAMCCSTHRHPRLREPERVIEIGERVQLHLQPAPLAFDLRAKVGGEAGRLADVASDDVLIHVRDPLWWAQTAKRPFELAAPERPDHDIESRTSTVLGPGRWYRRRTCIQGAMRLNARTSAPRNGA